MFRTTKRLSEVSILSLHLLRRAVHSVSIEKTQNYITSAHVYYFIILCEEKKTAFRHILRIIGYLYETSNYNRQKRYASAEAAATMIDRPKGYELTMCSPNLRVDWYWKPSYYYNIHAGCCKQWTIPSSYGERPALLRTA